MSSYEKSIDLEFRLIGIRGVFDALLPLYKPLNMGYYTFL